jgi:hypothetical protein
MSDRGLSISSRSGGSSDYFGVEWMVEMCMCIYAIVEHNFFVHSFSVELLGVFRPPKNNDFVVQVNGLWTTVPILGELRYATT